MDQLRTIQPHQALRAPAPRRDSRRRRGGDAFRLPADETADESPENSRLAERSDSSDTVSLPVSAPLEDEAGARVDFSA